MAISSSLIPAPISRETWTQANLTSPKQKQKYTIIFHAYNTHFTAALRKCLMTTFMQNPFYGKIMFMYFEIEISGLNMISQSGVDFWLKNQMPSCTAYRPLVGSGWGGGGGLGGSPHHLHTGIHPPPPSASPGIPKKPPRPRRMK